MDAFGFFKEHYFFEIERKDKLNGSLSFPVGIIALLAGAVSVMAKSISLPPSENQKVLIVLLVLAGACLVISCYYLVRTYWGHPYKYLPFSADLLHYRKELTTYYISSGQSPQIADLQSTQDFSDHVLEQYAADAKFNAISNDKKSAILFKANAFIIAALVMVVAGIPSHVYQQVTAAPELYKVQLTNKVIPVTNEREQEPTRQPERQETPAQPVKPRAPPSREIKEHVEKPRQQ